MMLTAHTPMSLGIWECSVIALASCSGRPEVWLFRRTFHGFSI